MQSFWDLAYADGDHVDHWEDPEPGRSIDRLADAGWLQGPGLALDLGCGGGLEAAQLARHGYRVVGLDSSLGALSIARDRVLGSVSSADRRIAWCRANALAVPLASSSIDLVYDRGCLHCLEEADTRRRYAAEAARLLRPNGLLIVTGSRSDDDERGLSAVDRDTATHVFSPSQWLVEAIDDVVLHAPAGPLPAMQLVLRRR